MNLLNIAVVQLQRNDFPAAHTILEQIEPAALEQRAYLYYGTYAEYFYQIKKTAQAVDYLEKAINLTKNDAELEYLIKRKEEYQDA